MKKRIISLVLAVALAIGCLVTPSAGAGYQFDSDYIDLYQDYGMIPLADVNDAAVVKGGSRVLRFRCGGSARPEKFYCVTIYRGSMEQVAQDFDRARDPEVMDFFYVNSQEITERTEYQMSVEWKADSRYAVGDYCLVCYALNAENNTIYDGVDLYWTDLHVLSAPRPATDMSVWAMKEDGWDEIGDVYWMKDWSSSLYLIAEPEPYPSTDALNCTVYASPSHVVSEKSMSCGYAHLNLRMEGIARVSIVSGSITKSFWLKVGDFDEKTKLKIYRKKTDLCVGQEDQCEIRSKENYNMFPAAGLWTSSDPSIATVGTRGEVKALRPGKVQITAVSAGFTETVEYTVHYHTLPEGTPVSVRTATQNAQAVGRCSTCKKNNAVNVYEEAIFTDTVATAWYAKHVDKLYDLGLMNGTGEHTFAPDANVTRAMAATVLYRVAGKPEVEHASPFTDVPEKKYYSDAVAWAAESGVVTGFPDGTFRPDENITREQLAAILYRYTAAIDPEFVKNGYLDGFPDLDKVHAYARKAVGWALVNELIKGVGENGKTYLKPRDNATRAQFATIISRYLAFIEALTPPPEEPKDPENPTPDPLPADPDAPAPAR